jgi:Kdo2-lipid IVA lauroyltransferase/acyltransferase
MKQDPQPVLERRQSPPLPSFQTAFLAPRYWGVWLGMGLLRLCSLLPYRLTVSLGSAIGVLYYLLSAKRRRIARINLGLCFPEWSGRERRRCLRRHFCYWGRASLCVGIAWWGSPARLQQLMHFRGREHYDQALAQGKRVMLLAPHFVNLEMAGALLSMEHLMVSMYKGPKNALFDWVMRRARARFDLIMIERSTGIRSILRFMQTGRPFYYLPDQEPGGASFEFVPFFGIPTATITAMSRIAEMAQAVVMPCFICQLPGGQGYEISFKPALEGFPSGDLVGDVTRMNAEIEKGVREMPEQYMWTYKRFKTRPDNAPSYYGRHKAA